MPRNNPNERFSVSLPSDLAQALRDQADSRYDGNLSAALAEAVGHLVTYATVRERGLAAMDEYEAEYGAFTEEELAEARVRVAAEMGWDINDPRLHDRRSA